MRVPGQLPTVARGSARQAVDGAAQFGPDGLLDTVSSVVTSPHFWKGVGGAATVAGALASAFAGD